MIEQHIEENNYFVDRNGGLRLNGELVLHSDLEPLAIKLGVKPPEVYSRLVELVRAKNLKEQKRLTAKVLFAKIETAIAEIQIDATGHTDALTTRFADLIIDIAEEIQILISTNTYRSFLMSRADENVPFKRDDLETALNSIILAANLEMDV